jgi:hypothetical protein
MKSNIIIIIILTLCVLSLCALGSIVGYIALQANNGQYVCADGDDVVADRDEIGPWEAFKVIDQGNGYIALRAHTGKYLCAEDGGGDDLVADRDEIGPWEKFKVIYQGNGYVALQAYNGQYVCAEDGGGDDVVADRDEIGPWERFKVLSTSKDGGLIRQASGADFLTSGMQEPVLKILDTIPSGARLWIWKSNKWIDTGKKTPCSYELDRDGKCKFKLTKTGYKDFIKEVNINGETSLGRINLVKKK